MNGASTAVDGDASANLLPGEQRKFGALADGWWDRDGPSRTLHDINPCRLGYIQDHAVLGGARVLDVGCGGGILSEALAAAGARVVGLDATPEVIAVARRHAAEQALAIEYLVGLSGELGTAYSGAFDVVTCMELVEHVPDADALVADCARLVRPGGQVFFSTLNRTPRAWLLGVVAAEYALGLLPRGTHDYARFLKPSELAASARRHGLRVVDIRGMDYNPFTRRARLAASPALNYLACLTRDPR